MAAVMHSHRNFAGGSPANSPFGRKSVIASPGSVSKLSTDADIETVEPNAIAGATTAPVSAAVGIVLDNDAAIYDSELAAALPLLEAEEADAVTPVDEGQTQSTAGKRARTSL